MTEQRAMQEAMDKQHKFETSKAQSRPNTTQISAKPLSMLSAPFVDPYMTSKQPELAPRKKVHESLPVSRYKEEFIPYSEETKDVTSRITYGFPSYCYRSMDYSKPRPQYASRQLTYKVS
jgi:hypothetical protein